MNPALTVKLSAEAEKVVANFQALPGRMVQAIARAMDQSSELAIAKIQKDHLTGRGPFPPELHRLGVRTDRLRGSIWQTAALEVSAGQLESAIGSNVIYAAIHEYGGTIHHEGRQIKVRHRTDSRGNLLRRALTRIKKDGTEVTSPNSMLIFAKSSHQRAREKTVDVKAHDVTLPERAPFRTGLAESRPIYNRKVSAAVIAAMEDLGK